MSDDWEYRYAGMHEGWSILRNGTLYAQGKDDITGRRVLWALQATEVISTKALETGVLAEVLYHADNVYRGARMYLDESLDRDLPLISEINLLRAALAKL